MKLQDLATLKTHRLRSAHRAWTNENVLYNAGWERGEWTCAECGTMIGKNLNGDGPYALAREHAEKCNKIAQR